jgi:hypothetical protein
MRVAIALKFVPSLSRSATWVIILATFCHRWLAHIRIRASKELSIAYGLFISLILSVSESCHARAVSAAVLRYLTQDAFVKRPPHTSVIAASQLITVQQALTKRCRFCPFLFAFRAVRIGIFRNIARADIWNDRRRQDLRWEWNFAWDFERYRDRDLRWNSWCAWLPSCRTVGSRAHRSELSTGAIWTSRRPARVFCRVPVRLELYGNAVSFRTRSDLSNTGSANSICDMHSHSIGPLPNPLLLAPMFGVTDAPFRRVAASLGAGLLCRK